MSNKAETQERSRRAERYDPRVIEQKWQARWELDNLYVTPDDDPRPKWYALTMLPYTSGDLHIGHWYAMAPSDTAARFKRMSGYNVLFPMGFDAFGLPAENAAIKNHTHPLEWTLKNIERMRGQLKMMGAMFDWTREVVTASPDYYKWTQWWFLKLLEHDLAYRKKASVWWCPNDQTVLANEQVVDGRCERCDATVSKRDLEQWFFRITRYAEELLDFSRMEWPEQITSMQRNWIGRSEGAELRFGLDVPGVEEQRDPRVHHAPRHGVRRHVLRPRAGAPAAREDHDAGATRRGACVRRRSAAGVGDRAAVDGAREDGRVHRRLRHQPVQRREGADLDGRLRALHLRHRRRHGRARPRPARLRFREEVRAGDHPRVPPSGLGWRRVDGRRSATAAR